MADDQDDRFPSERMDRFIVRMPDGMRDRIKAEAEANNRSMNAEIVATLSLAYPTPMPFSSDLAYMILMWREGEWRLIDEDDWSRFRAGKESVLPQRMRDGDNYIVVVVIDEDDRPCNIITHNFRKSASDVHPAHWDLLSADEHKEYNHLFSALKHSEDDEERIRELQNKMEAAFVMNSEMVAKLRSGLINIAPRELVDALLAKRIKATRDD